MKLSSRNNEAKFFLLRCKCYFQASWCQREAGEEVKRCNTIHLRFPVEIIQNLDVLELKPFCPNARNERFHHQDLDMKLDYDSSNSQINRIDLRCAYDAGEFGTKGRNFMRNVSIDSMP